MSSLLLVLAATSAWAVRPADATVAIQGGDYGVTCHAIPGGEEQCLQVLAAIDEAWRVQVETIGFNAPLPDDGRGGDNGLDVYLSHFGTGGAGGAYVTCDGDGAECEDFAPNDGLASTPSFIVIDPELDDPTLRRYCHHEFNHVLQYATDFEEPFLSVWEGTATAAETWTNPDAPLDQGPLEDYQGYPWVSSVLQDGYWLDEEYGVYGYYEYGAVLWVMWLDQRWGDGQGSIGPALWGALANDPGENEPDVLDAWSTISGDWRTDFLEFAAARGNFGTDREPEWLTAIGGAPEVAHRQMVANGDYAQISKLYPLGANYIDVKIEWNSTGAVSAAVIDGIQLIAVNVPETVVVSADPVANTLAFSGVGTVRVAVVNVAPATFDADSVLTAQNVGVATAIDNRNLLLDDPTYQSCGSGLCGGFGVALLAPSAVAFIRRRKRRNSRQLEGSARSEAAARA